MSGGKQGSKNQGTLLISGGKFARSERPARCIYWRSSRAVEDAGLKTACWIVRTGRAAKKKTEEEGGVRMPDTYIHDGVGAGK